MSASLVGSEMCIRDSCTPFAPVLLQQPPGDWRRQGHDPWQGRDQGTSSPKAPQGGTSGLSTDGRRI
eukprot:6031426-Alexandrium_andersonii.AAC.1